MIKLIITIALLLVFSMGCSSVTGPVTPDIGPITAHIQTDDNHWLWGTWLFYVSADHTRIEVVPQRHSGYHFCVTKFVEENPCKDCLLIGKPYIQPDGTIKLNVTLRHPFPGQPRYTGFDVRGMIYLPATQSHSSDLTYSSLLTGSGNPNPLFPDTSRLPLIFSTAEDGGGELLNADGYSCYLIPGVTYSLGWPIYSYQPGKHGIEPTPQTTINPYKLFTSDIERRMFRTYDQITREYHIALPEGEFCFGYAVDASWWPPDNIPVTDPATDFPQFANSEDPWLIEYEQLLPVKKENETKDIFKVTVHHRGGEPMAVWNAHFFSWDLSLIGQDWPYPKFCASVYEIIDEYTTVGHIPLVSGWHYIYGDDGKAVPGHHLGVLVVSNSMDGVPGPEAELRFVYGVRFVDIYVEE